jgi:Mrp family chromosome partitioning ATPase/predicted Fe-Mo cluster-binding NifX family protein
MSESHQDEIAEMEQRLRAAMKGIPHKLLVMSGKGGVGKTTLAVNLAFVLAEQGYEVGLLDVDLHGPNVALMAGVEGHQAEHVDGHFLAAQAAPGVRVLSIAFFLPHPDAPVAWRGPRKSGAIRQLLADGDWAGVDVLVVDCPPGTGDEPMSVAQLIPGADGAVVVTSPQDVSLLDSRKCVRFVEQMNLRPLGIVENLSGFVCPACGEPVDLFKTGGGERAALELGVPFLGRVPLSVHMVEAGDSGRPLVVSHPEDPAAVALRQVVNQLTKRWQVTDAPKEQAGMNDKKIVAVATEDDKALEGEVSMHFGRCRYYTLVEVQDGRVGATRCVENPYYDNHQPGVMPQFIHGLGADVILAGGMGPKAVQLFHGFGMDVATGAVGRVDKVVEAYLAGRLAGTVPCNHDHPESCGGHAD